MTGRPLPIRPRLADHAALRREVTDGRERLWVRDEVNDDEIALDASAFEIVRGADGTRDLGGVALAAVRARVYRRASEVEGVLAALHERGLLADGLEPEPPAATTPGDRPLEVLPGFVLRCDGNGACCSTHGVIAMTEAEAGRARALVPDVLADEAGRARGFLPLLGSAPSRVVAVSLVDGRCPYLDEHGRCRIHSAGGPAAKPVGCRVFPATFVDDGEAVRVSVAVECPCVVESACGGGAAAGGGGGAGEPLVPRGARVVADLLAGTPVVALPTAVRVAGLRTVAPAALRPWAAAVVAHIEAAADPLAALLALADAVRDVGLDPAAAARAAAAPPPPAATSLGLGVMRLASRARRVADGLGAAGAGETPPGRLARWVAAEAEALTDPSAAARGLAGPGDALAHERFAVRSAVFGHHLAGGPLTLEQALRDRAVRLLVARRLGDAGAPPDGVGHPAARTPVAAVEALATGRGLVRRATSDRDPAP